MSKNKRGRPNIFGKDAPRITIKMDDDLKEAVNQVVKEQRTNASAYLRGLIMKDEKIIKKLEEIKNE